PEEIRSAAAYLRASKTEEVMLGRRQFVGALSATGVAAPFGARAQAWPPSRVTVVVPFPAGAATDIGARVYAEQLTALWGQPVVWTTRAAATASPLPTRWRAPSPT